ncbi:hypothetical protein [Paraburkholderia franconis]|uniref:hypothetical protein n=1 Tax=Paraburkholderia franconis TaxID=2654983 RepID=UPI001D1194CD|nr:hypothetical protein [Paraburkholderia franconis]
MEPWDVVHLTTGASGLLQHSVDTRFGSNTYNLPNGPYQISRVGPDYGQCINSPVHRLYQNLQQADCDIDQATLDNPSGCQMDLFAWVETSVGVGSNGKPPPYSRGGRVAHQYADHVSIVKFIERNWHLKPVTQRSRDNLPNPIQLQTHPYVPVNAPAIDDLFDAFNFPRTP